MRNWWNIAFSVVCTLLGAGLILMLSTQPRGQAITLSSPPPPEPITIHIVGAVVKPGVYSLPYKSRVKDAIEAAGGLLPNADPHAINLAAFLEDGARIAIPFLPTLQPTSQAFTTPDATLPNPEPNYPININNASLAELETLPGIGPSTAEMIITYRENNGLFASINDIQNVPGIGPKKFAAIQDLITVEIYP